MTGLLRTTSLALLLALLLGGRPAAAQEVSDDESRRPMHFRLDDLRTQYKGAQRRRNIGIILAAPGVAMCVLGSVLIGYGRYDNNLISGATLIASGVVVDSIGLAFTIPGLVLWLQGQERMDRTSWRWQQEGELGLPR